MTLVWYLLDHFGHGTRTWLAKNTMFLSCAVPYSKWSNISVDYLTYRTP